MKKLLLGLGLAVLGTVAACNAIVDGDQYHFASSVVVTPDAGKDAAPAVECNLNADCATKGTFQICKKTTHTCVALQSAECTHVAGDYQDDNAVIFGSILPTLGADKSSGLPLQDALDLAVADFKRAGGLPPVPGSSASRPLAFVGCDDNSDSEQAVRVANHLAKDIGVPAIVGAAFSGITIAVANGATIQNDVMLISPSATSTEITTLVDKGLVWRTSPSDVFQAKADVALYPKIENEVKKTLPTPTTPVKVAIAFKGDAYGSGLANAVSQSLVINGTPATGTANTPNFQFKDYGNPDDPATDATKYDSVAQEILDATPQVIFLFGITETVTEMMRRIENGWPPPSAATPLPIYVLADGSLIPELPAYIATAKHPDVRTRIYGTIYGSNSSTFSIFRTSYTAFVTDGSSADTGGTANAYDALYNLAFATVAVGGNPITGTSLKDAFSKLVPGTGATSYTVGKDAITAAYQTLLAGNAIDYNGASGPLDYDLTTGDAPSDIQIWCVPLANGAPAAGRPSGSTFYRASDNSLQGRLEDISTSCGFK